MRNPAFISYWRWLFCGSGDKAGFWRFFDIWLPVHCMVGVAMALIVPASLRECANAVLLPLAGIIIGLAFAWAGNAQALLQTNEIEDIAGKHAGGFEEYIYVYQTAILILLSTLVAWSLAGLDVFDGRWPVDGSCLPYITIKSVLFFLSSIALRECWHVVLGAQWMLLLQHHIRKARKGSAK